MHGVEFAILLHRVLETRVQELHDAAAGEGQEEDSGGLAHAEGLHRTRVACRRLRAVLDLLDGDTYPSLEAKAKALRRFAKNLGPVRELDVQASGLMELHARPGNEAHQGAIEHLLEQVARRRRKASEALSSKSPTFTKLLRVPSLPAPFQGTSVAQGAWDCLKPCIEEAFGGIAGLRDQEDAARLHESRIRVKRLRDTLEALIPAFSVEPAVFVMELRAMQKALGDHHDLTSLETFLAAQGDHLEKAGRTVLASSLGVLRDQAAKAREEAFETFRALDGPWDGAEFAARVQALLGVSAA